MGSRQTANQGDKMKNEGEEIYAIKNIDETYSLLYSDNGYPVTKLDECFPIVWPINSELSAYYEHSEGITLNESDFKKTGIELEDVGNNR